MYIPIWIIVVIIIVGVIAFLIHLRNRKSDLILNVHCGVLGLSTRGSKPRKDILAHFSHTR
jgi:hypothetical protein